MLDNINIYYDGSDEIEAAINEYEEFIKKETLTIAIERINDDSIEKQDLNGQMTGILLEKVSK